MGKEAMLVTVVIPLYDKEQTIGRAIDSVLKQTCQDFQLIIIDDGSRDGSFREASSIKDARIRIISQAHRGVSAARNRGVAEGASEFVAFLDADDEWAPAFLAETERMHSKYPDCGMLASSYTVVLPRGGTDSPSNHSRYAGGWEVILDDVFRDFRVFPPFNSSSVVVRKDLLASAGGFPEDVSEGEDVLTWLKLATITKIAYINAPLAIYHQEAQNRAVPRYENRLGQYAPVGFVLELLRSGALPPHLRQSAIEYVAKHQIVAARRNLRAGNSQFARQLLRSCRGTRIYRSKLRKTMALSLLPPKVLALLVKRKLVL